MQEISIWGMSIVGAVAFAAFAEMLMPSGDIKKYVSLVLGIILVLIMIKPLIKLKDIAVRGANLPAVNVQVASLDTGQDDLIIRSYQKQLEYTVESRILAAVGERYEAKVEVGEDGEIEHITVYGVSAADSARVMAELVGNFAAMDRVTIL